MAALAVAAPLTGASWGASNPGGASWGGTSKQHSRLAAVIVRALPGAEARAEAAVRLRGGSVGTRLPIVNGFAAKLPSSAVGRVRDLPFVLSVTPNATVQAQSKKFEAPADQGSMYNTTLVTGAQAMWKAGYTGKGIGVALIDSGVAPVDGLTVSGKVVNGPDLSFESQAPNLRYLDTYGHGTHLAGIIAGRAKASSGSYVGDTKNFLGMAPDARILSIKVADAHGATDVSQVIAAIDWVVQHKNDNGLNIRVLNLSYGTNSTQPAVVDPLAYAAEVAWKKGIVVVAAAGNAGFAPTGSLTNPATDPYVLAVGSADTKGTLGMYDDTVSAFSSSSNWTFASNRLVDVVAPGEHIVSLRVPGSFIDQQFSSTGAVTSTLFRGSGTSQAAAVVSGAVALVLQQRPSLTPDEVKRLLTYSAMQINAPAVSEGYGELNLATGLAWPTAFIAGYNQGNYVTSGTGTGKLEGARGTNHLVKDGVSLSGEKDIFGKPFNSGTMAAAEANGSSWSGGMWNGSSWSGSSWSGSSWSGSSWSGSSWSGSSWSGSSWSSTQWSGSSWSGSSWSGSSWSSNNWLGGNWADNAWSGATWN